MSVDDKRESIESIEQKRESRLYKRNLAILLLLIMLPIGAYQLYGQSMRKQYDPLKNYSPASVTLYSASWCSYCKHLRRYLTENNVQFKEYDVETSEQGYWGHRSVGGGGVPVMVIGDEIFYGFGRSNLPQIKAALAKAGYKTLM
jgi:glutaredoxin